MEPQLFQRKHWGRVNEDFVTGGAIPNLESLLVPASDVPELSDVAGVDIDVVLLEELQDQLLEKFPDADDKENQSKVEIQRDQFFAPRLHFALRIPRKLAAQREFWAWLAVGPLRRFVAARVPKATKPEEKRRWYIGDGLDNALSRLWWGAELTRNGPDYSTVPPMFVSRVVTQYGLDKFYSRYRPGAIAFANVANGRDGKDPLSTAELERLSKALNAYLTTTVLEMVGLSEDGGSYDREWRLGKPSVEEVLAPVEELRGPAEGTAETDSVKSLELWIRKTLEESEQALKLAGA